MQAAIDSAKRKFDVDVTKEIKRIKRDVNVKLNGYPAFWLAIRPGFNKKNINWNLKCPMNNIYNIKLPMHQPKESTIPIGDLFIQHRLSTNYKLAKKVQHLIEKYSLDLYHYQLNSSDAEKFLILSEQYDDLINDLKQLQISNKYVALFAWLLNRTFFMTMQMRNNANVINSKLSRNRAILLKILYDVNSDILLQCFKSGKSVV